MYVCAAAAAAKSLQSCPTLCDPLDSSHQAPPSLGFSRQEHWSGLPFPSPMQKSEKWKVKGKSLSRVRLFATPWTAAYQAPPSMRFSRQEYWSGVPLSSPVCMCKDCQKYIQFTSNSDGPRGGYERTRRPFTDHFLVILVNIMNLYYTFNIKINIYSE